MATISSTSSSISRSARGSLRRACSTGSSTTIRNRRSSTPSPHVIRHNNYELTPVLRTFLRSNVFYSSARLSRAREESGRVRRRHVQGAGTLRRSTERAVPALAADGTAALLSAQRRGLAGRPELADERHDDRAAKLPDALARIADVRRLVMAARASGRSRKQRSAAAGADDSARRRRTGFASRSSKRYLSGSGSAALATLSRRELRSTRARRGLSHDGDARLSVELDPSTGSGQMKRKNFLLATASGLAVVANTRARLRARARAVAAAGIARQPKTAASSSINLYGGNDGLNCVVPHGDPRYYQLRPGLAIDRSDVLAIDAHVGLNPEMRSFKALYDKGIGRDRSGRRLSESRPFALPLDRDLADRRARSLRAYRLARPLFRR